MRLMNTELHGKNKFDLNLNFMLIRRVSYKKKQKKSLLSVYKFSFEDSCVAFQYFIQSLTAA